MPGFSSISLHSVTADSALTDAQNGQIETPTLSGDALRAVESRGSHIQIVATAGSGKTEVVAQRIARLLAEGVAPESIVAFTFTERAAAELKSRIRQRFGVDTSSPTTQHLPSDLYVGTIHGYCLSVLKERMPSYEAFDTIDDHQVTILLAREAKRLGIRALDPKERLFSSIDTFTRNLAVVENELVPHDDLPEHFRSMIDEFHEMLNGYRLMTFGQQIASLVAELERGSLADEIHQTLRHLIVDEYQDVNPAQECLIRLLTGPNTQLCVVGDDDQSIYQWRGAAVSNLITFGERYSPVEVFELGTNRRSSEEIVAAANSFAQSIPGRLPKQAGTVRQSSTPSVLVWSAEDEELESMRIATAILDMRSTGVPFSDIAVLVRSQTACARIIEAFADHAIPTRVGPGVRLFHQTEATLLAKLICMLGQVEWAEGWGRRREPVELDELLHDFGKHFRLSGSVLGELERWIDRTLAAAHSSRNWPDLVGEFYELLELMDIARWSLDDPGTADKLGVLGRFSELLVKYEGIWRRSRVHQRDRVTGGPAPSDATWYYANLAVVLVNALKHGYPGFAGEERVDVDAVDLSTVHGAKGLEWPVVFLPSLTAKRFPSARTGRSQEWIVPTRLFDAARYEGTEADERRLFYVGLTRARDLVVVSRHDRVNVQSVKPSPYWHHMERLSKSSTSDDSNIEPTMTRDAADLELSFSDLALFHRCPHAYRLRRSLGFQPKFSAELGYGRAVHHLIRHAAAIALHQRRPPTTSEIDQVAEQHFYLPYASPAAFPTMRASALRCVKSYVADYQSELLRVHTAEMPCELSLPGARLSGRVDLVTRQEKPATGLAIVDFKTSTKDADHTIDDLQLAIYTSSLRRNGLDVQAASVHDLKGRRRAVVIDSEKLQAAQEFASEAVDRIRTHDFEPSPGPHCQSCDVRSVCGAASNLTA